MHRPIIIVGGLLLVGAVAMVVLPQARLPAQQDQAENKAAEAKAWMQKKLEFSQRILAGLALADFEKIRKNAENMNFIDYFEKWSHAERRDYRQQLEMFEHANQELILQATRKNLEGATLAFNQLTVSCVQCHKIIRDNK